jgi:hypothetical protein
VSILHDQEGKRRKSPLRVLLVVAALALFATLSSTLAANIAINTGSPAEFGQGIATSTICDSYLEIRASTTFDGSAHNLDTIEIGDISTLTHDNNLSIQIYDSGTATGLLQEPAVVKVGADGSTFTKTSQNDNTTLETVTVDTSSLGSGSKNEKGKSVIRLKSITSDGTNPIPASDIFKFTIQSDGNGYCTPIYSIGDVGPAGGTVGILPTTAGNTTGLYFEFAVKSASEYVWCPQSSTGGTNVVGTSNAIGAGAANTTKIVAACASGGAVYADSYTFGGYSDWFLPSLKEIYEVRDIAPAGRYLTSTERSAVEAFIQALPTANPIGWDFWGKHWTTSHVLPMRTFSN